VSTASRLTREEDVGAVPVERVGAWALRKLIPAAFAMACLALPALHLACATAPPGMKGAAILHQRSQGVAP